MITADSKLKQIADSIANYSANPKEEPDMGLYTGTVGFLMFMAYYSRYSGEEKYKKITDRLFEDCCESICNGMYYTPFCGGLSGALYGLNHLDQLGYLDIDLTEVHKDYSQHLIISMKSYAKEGRIDFMHEATGIAIYLLQYGTSSDLIHVGEYVKLLHSTADQENGVAKWKTDMNAYNTKIYNIAMSHGMSSIAIFLAQCIEKGVESQISNRLLTGVINYILQQEIDHKKYGSYFPFTSLESDISKSRMAWCYGDLGIAIALWRAGSTLDNIQWKSKAIEILEFAADRRRDLGSNMVADACICHGTAGIAQIFKRMYYNTRNNKFLSANEFWIDETLKMAKWDDGSAAGFKAFRGPSNENIDMYDLLEGIAGIGLALIGSQGCEQFSSWDKVLLLS